MNRKMKNKIKNLFIKVIILFIISIIVIIIDNNKPKRVVSGDLEVYYFDVGQADSALIINKDKVMMIDCGNNEDGEYLVDELNDLGIEKIDYLIGTHPHEDHIGGMDDIINNFDIGIIYMPNVIHPTNYYTDILEAADKNNVSIETPKIGDSFDLSDALIDILYLNNDVTNLNDDSIILKITYGENKFLFMGDASKLVEKEIINDDISADVLKVGHHGSSESSSNSFLDKVGGGYAIISVGVDNKYGHPTKSVLNNLKKYDYEILRTDVIGTIKIISDGKNIKVGD